MNIPDHPGTDADFADQGIVPERETPDPDMKDTIALILICGGLAMLTVAFLLLGLPLWVNLAVFGLVILIVGCALLEDDGDDDDSTDCLL